MGEEDNITKKSKKSMDGVKGSGKGSVRHITVQDIDTDSSSKALSKTRKSTIARASTVAPKKKKSKKVDASKIVLNEAELVLPTVRKLHFKIRYIVLAVLVLLVGGFVTRVAIWEHNYLAEKVGSERDVVIEEAYEAPVDEEGNVEEVETEEPTPVQVAEYTVPYNYPRYLTIRTLGIYNARIQTVGMTAAGAIDTPVNIYNVGWYTGSPLPGTGGTTIMDAHGGDLGQGIFKYLPRIGMGDVIEIQMGDGVTTYRYQVADYALKTIAEANDYMPIAFSSPSPGVPSLTLITCTGNWIQTQQTYTHRLFVRATLVQ